MLVGVGVVTGLCFRPILAQNLLAGAQQCMLTETALNTGPVIRDKRP